MYEAYAIGVTLKLNNLVSPQLLELSKQFERMDVLVTGLNKSFKGLSIDASGMRSISRAVDAADRSFAKAAASAELYERRLQTLQRTAALPAAAPIVSALPGGGGSARVPNIMAAAAGAPIAGPVAAARAAGTGGAPPPGGGGGGNRGGLHGGNIHMGPGGIGIGSVGLSGSDLFPALAVGAAAAYGSKSLFEAGKSLDVEQQKFRLLGLSETQNQEAFRFVAGLRIYGTTMAENMASFTEAQGVGREAGLEGSEALQFAKVAAPWLAKLDALGEGLDGESKAAWHESNVALLRFAEQTGGLKDASAFGRQANLAYKLRTSSGGTIDYEQLRQITAKGGAYTQNMTPEGFALAEPLAQELKGNAYGVGVSTAGDRLFGVLSRPPKNLITEATRLGLWTPTRMHLSDEDETLYKDSFVKFYMDRIIPLYDQFNLSPNERLRENGILFQKTGARVANLIEKQLPSIQRSFAAFNQAKDIQQAMLQLPDSLNGEQLEFSAAWKDFKIAWSQSALPYFTGALKFGASALRFLGPGLSVPVSGLAS